MDREMGGQVNGEVVRCVGGQRDRWMDEWAEGWRDGYMNGWMGDGHMDW